MEKPEIFDVVIIGGGPAGLTAALYAARKSLKVVLISKTIGGNVVYAGMVENYLGLPPMSGMELVDKFRESVERFIDASYILEGKQVVSILGTAPNFEVIIDDGAKYQTKTIIIATGSVPKKLNIPGESKYFGRGVASCATCDAPLFKGKDVAVVGGGNAALDAILSLSQLANTIYVVNSVENFTGDPIRVKKLEDKPNIKILHNHLGVEILGDEILKSLKVKNIKTKEEQILSVQGVFIEIGYTPATDFDNLTKKNNMGQIMVNENLETSISGIWAAGDANNLWGEQILISAGEGAKAALGVNSYLQKLS